MVGGRKADIFKRQFVEGKLTFSEDGWWKKS
jgi:hypothetical protein